MLDVESVGKVPDQSFAGAGDAQKSVLINGSTIDDLMIGKNKVPPENSVKIIKVTFSTDLLGLIHQGIHDFHFLKT
jgi:hypothetical protein